MGKPKKQFVQLSRAWHGKANLLDARFVDEITIGLYYSDRSTDGQFSIRWQYISDKEIPVLVAYDDSWKFLFEFQELIEMLKSIDNENTTPKRFCELLVEIGIEDRTPEINPYGEEKPDSLYKKPSIIE